MIDADGLPIPPGISASPGGGSSSVPAHTHPSSVTVSAWKEPVRAASTGNLTISGPGANIDGVTMAAQNRFLAKDQSTASQNGIYVWLGAAVAAVRAADFSTGSQALGATTLVSEGAVNADRIYKCTTNATITLGTTSLVFSDISGTSNAELNIEGGQSVIHAHGAMGATETFDPTLGNVHTRTLDANCTFTISAPVGSGASTLTFWITGSGTNTWTWPGSVTWLAGTAPDPPADGLTTVVVLTSVDGGTNWVGGPWGAGSESPLTTKGDLWGFSTLDARVPVGANLTVLTGDSTATLGVSYKTLETLGHWEPLMDGGSPYAPLDDGTVADWLFVFVPG